MTGTTADIGVTDTGEPTTPAEVGSHSLMFDVDSAERAAEHLRQALGLLGKLSVAPAPLYYTLFYNYVSGKSVRLNKEVDALIQEPGALDKEDAVALFQRFFGVGGETLIEDIRTELVTMAAQVIGALVDIAGKTSLTNEAISAQIDRLADAGKPSEAIAAATAILSETREFVTESRQFEAELLSSVEEMHKLKQELSNAKREASIDGLTGLYNRRSFDRRLNELIAAADGLDNGFCLLFLDIDHFKKVNDSFGHMVGDKVLSEFGRQIGKLTRRSDFLARYGGEEFAVLLPGTRMTNAFTVAENIRNTLQLVRLRRSSSRESLGAVTVSLGVACYRVGESAEDFISRCDKALYRAKRLGRNRTVLAD
ncbi:MAG: GGDEF domain-containing protein [Sedimenticolaceae bacterium]